MKKNVSLFFVLISFFILAGVKHVVAATSYEKSFFNVISADSTTYPKSVILTFSTASEVKCSVSYLADGSPVANIDTEAEGESAHYSKMHIMGISELENNTKYYYNLTCYDQNNNIFTNSSNDFFGSRTSSDNLLSFTTLAAGHEIKNLKSTVSANYNSVEISFNTDQASKCSVDYGIAGGAISEIKSQSEAEQKTQHSFTINNLVTWKNYIYGIVCINKNNNIETIFAQTGPLGSSGIDYFGNSLPTFSTIPTSGNIVQDLSFFVDQKYAGLRFHSIVPVKCAMHSLKADSTAKEISSIYDINYNIDHVVSLNFIPDPKSKYYYMVSCRDQKNYFYFTKPGIVSASALGVITSSDLDGSDKSFPGFKVESSQVFKPALNLDTNQMDLTAKTLFAGSISDMATQLKEDPNPYVEKMVATYIKKITPKTQKLSETAKVAVQSFVTYGTDKNTKILGVNGRESVIESFVAAFKKVPSSEKDLSDTMKIANGIAPSQVSVSAENKAKVQFIKAYGRSAQTSNSNDQDAVKTIAYGLRQPADERDLKAETSAVNNFKKIYGQVPVSAADWNLVTALAYSDVKK